MANSSDQGHTAGTEVPANESHGHAAFPPFDPANFTPLLIWLVLSFGVLYLLMSKLALPRVAGILHVRSEKISADLNEAQALRARSQEAANQHDKTLSEAKAKAQALAQETHALLHSETEAKRQAIETDLNSKLAAAESRIAETKAKAMENVDAIAREAAAAIVQHFTGKPADPKAVAAAVGSTKA
ncbi:MAG TPA: F0F1 ATP synthase subunit B' [Beijerinckia sp.]|jgi:F-type H+-transporting ATPase subunit b|nr:F0F1 ATP synthase subunit B' [Beijerinckia sp.]